MRDLHDRRVRVKETGRVGVLDYDEDDPYGPGPGKALVFVPDKMNNREVVCVCRGDVEPTDEEAVSHLWVWASVPVTLVGDFRTEGELARELGRLAGEALQNSTPEERAVMVREWGPQTTGSGNSDEADGRVRGVGPGRGAGVPAAGR